MNDNGSHKIQGIIKDSKGEITAYKLEDGSTVDKVQGVIMAKEGRISDVLVSKSKMGEEFLRSIPDGDKTNNLDDLPTENK
ncbi:MAG: DUF3892 domain-containing protein [Clostridiaceae bacterium]